MTKSKTVHLENDIHEYYRTLAFKNRTSIREEIHKVLKKKMEKEI